MKTIFDFLRRVQRHLTPLPLICLIAAITPFSTTHAQEESATDMNLGFIRLVNAVAQGDGQLTLHINGVNMHPKGYRLGGVTGGMGFAPGMQRVTIKRDGVEEGSTDVRVEKGLTTTLIPYAEKVPASDEKPAYWAIRILRLRQMEPESDRSATFVSVTSMPELKVELGVDEKEWASGFVKRLGVTQLPVKQSGGYARLRVNNTELKAIAVPNTGNYVIVIYEDPEQKIQTLNFRDVKFLSAD